MRLMGTWGPMRMNAIELHALLTGPAGLVPEPADNGIARAYFYQRVDWHPGRSTRVLRVLYDAQGKPARIQRCVSSDNNNAVLLTTPFEKRQVLEAAAQEVACLLPPPQQQGRGPGGNVKEK